MDVPRTTWARETRMSIEFISAGWKLVENTRLERYLTAASRSARCQGFYHHRWTCGVGAVPSVRQEFSAITTPMMMVEITGDWVSSDCCRVRRRNRKPVLITFPPSLDFLPVRHSSPHLQIAQAVRSTSPFAPCTSWFTRACGRDLGSVP